MNLTERLKNEGGVLASWYWLLIPLAVALVIRTIYSVFQVPDFWGDSYHNWYISWSILEHDWVYSDYKGRELVWLPFYRYIIAGFMYLFKTDGLLLANIFNVLTGSAACSVVAWFVSRFQDKQRAMIAGLLLAVLPWHIAYSAMNLPNILGGLLILVLLLQAYKERLVATAILTVICVLMRYELTYLLMFFGLITLIQKDWKLSASLLVGGLTGVGIWSWWSYFNTGDMLFWLETKSAGLSWDASFQQETYGQQRTWYYPLISILQAFPVILFFLFKFNIQKKSWDWKLYTPLLLATGHWLFMLVSQFRYFSHADPRYYVISLPLAVAGFMLIWNQEEFWNKMTNRILTGVMVLTFIIQMLSFQFLGHTWSKFIQVGNYIEQAEPEGNMWIDEPAVIYYSGIDPARAFSSDQIAPDEDNYEAGLEQSLDSLQVSHIVAFEASYSKTLWIWPEMKGGQGFTWKDYRFELVYRSAPFENKENTLFGRIRQQVEELKGTASVWSVEKVHSE